MHFVMSVMILSFVLMNFYLTGTPHATYICNVPRRPTWGRVSSTTATAETYGITVSTTTPTYGIHCSPTTLLPVTGFDDKWALPLLYGARGMDILCLVTERLACQDDTTLYWQPHSMMVTKPVLICELLYLIFH